MKIIIFYFAGMLLVNQAKSQSNIDSLKTVAAASQENPGKLEAIKQLARYYRWSVPDSTIYFSMLGLPIANKLGQERVEQSLYSYLGEASAGKGNFGLALEAKLKALKLAEKLGDRDLISWSQAGIGSVYFYSKDYRTALPYYLKTKNFPEVYSKVEKHFAAFIGETYYGLDELDSAYYYLNRAYELDKTGPHWEVPYYFLGKIMAKKNRFPEAFDFYRTALAFEGPPLAKIEGYNGIAELFMQAGEYDSAVFYARKGIEMADKLSFTNMKIQSSSVLKDVYKKMGLNDSAFKYMEVMLAAKDSVYSQDKVKQMQSVGFREQMKEQEILVGKTSYRNRVRLFILTGAVAIFILIALLLFRNNRIRQKAFIQLHHQKIQTETEKEKAEKALLDLEAAQTQLIQSEKMASLGELTSGIAHEIQNPLNFVKNFSEINTELIDELREELGKNNNAAANNIAKNIRDNEEKIIFHGKRADAIVKSMLQHSRQSAGKKEATDLNALADEYLRLSYHGLRARDKSFQAKFETDLDPTIGKLQVVPQDVGRVLLNLINNAFYAVADKQKQDGVGYDPTVTIRTRRNNDSVSIIVQDNGNGIAKNVLDKIFQPFFTTKPTGQGTGLGLSMSYDIVKAHGGQLVAETVEGEGSRFIISLPST